MSESRVTLSSTWQSVFTKPPSLDVLILGDPAQVGDICWSVDVALNGTTTTGGAPLGITTAFDASSLPGNVVYARSPSGATLTVAYR